MQHSTAYYVFSLVQPDEVSHIIFKIPPRTSRRKNRIDLLDPKNRLQCAVIELNADDTFKPHLHLSHVESLMNSNTQECWYVVSGSVLATLYDINGIIIKEVELESNTMLFTLKGGHNYKALSDNTIVIEFKSGPYLGPEIDKSAI